MTTPRDDISGLSERLRRTLPGIAQEETGGDNLAILLASYFEPGIEDDMLDDSGTWKQGAIDACDRVLDAIHAHYAAKLDALQARVKELEAELKDEEERGDEATRTFTEYSRLRAIAEARALRAEQKRDEAYERAAEEAELHCCGSDPETIAAHIRRLAGPEKEGK